MKHIRIVSFLFLSSSVLANPPSGKTNKIGMYYANWTVYRGCTVSTTLAHAANKIDYVFYAFANVNPTTYTAELSDSWADVRYTGRWADSNFAKLIALKRSYPHLKILFSIGGESNNANFLRIADAGTSALDTLAQSCLAILTHTTVEGTPYTYTGLFDGVDINWEWEDAIAPSPAYASAYLYFIEKVRSLITANHYSYLFTATIPADPGIYTGSTALNLRRIARAVNWINLITYDFFDPGSTTTNFDAPLYGRTSDDEYCTNASTSGFVTHGVPARQLALGIHFEGHTFRGVPCTSCGLRQRFTGPGTGPILGKYEAGTIYYKDIVNLVLSSAAQKKLFYYSKWDTTQRCPWLYSCVGHNFISYTNIQATTKICQYVKNRSLGGTFCWELCGDTTNNALLTNIRRTLGASH